MIGSSNYCQVDTEYLRPNQSPDKHRFVFAYHITIHNQRSEPAQLLGRHWIVTDSNEVEKGLSGHGRGW